MGFHMTHGHQIRDMGSNVDARIDSPPRESRRRQNTSLWEIGNPKLLNADISKLQILHPENRASQKQRLASYDLESIGRCASFHVHYSLHRLETYLLRV